MIRAVVHLNTEALDVIPSLEVPLILSNKSLWIKFLNAIQEWHNKLRMAYTTM